MGQQAESYYRLNLIIIMIIILPICDIASAKIYSHESIPYSINVDLPKNVIDNTNVSTSNKLYSEYITKFLFNFKVDANEKLVVELIEYTHMRSENISNTSLNVREKLNDIGASSLRTKTFEIDDCKKGKCKGSRGEGTKYEGNQKNNIYAVQYMKDNCINVVRCTITSRFLDSDSDIIFKNFKLICGNKEAGQV